jgi:hypothetical protein
MIQMLQAQRADYMFIAPEEAGSAITQAGLQASTFQVFSFPDMPQGEKRYMLFSRLVDDDTLRRVDKAIDEYLAEHH